MPERNFWYTKDAGSVENSFLKVIIPAALHTWKARQLLRVKAQLLALPVLVDLIQDACRGLYRGHVHLSKVRSVREPTSNNFHVFPPKRYGLASPAAERKEKPVLERPGQVNAQLQTVVRTVG